ncbi:MAG TPA: glucose-1-phosphate cytidylyltransferase [Bacteroidetes bacterium]|nr:glucose-1-phosphate cytidylyltransferase [Bacteroidota bacterium]
MKVLLLAGGFGTRMSEETEKKPKPMIPIGGKPILWHIMKLYSEYGYDDFVILLGYKGYMIKEYFLNYFYHQSDITIDIAKNKVEILNNSSENWKVTLLDTGLHTMTGGRVLRAKKVIGDEPFMLTYGDGVGNVEIDKLVEFHNSHDGILTMTTVQPEGRFGGVGFASDEQRVDSFMEKPKGEGGWINAGFFVCNPEVLDYIQDGDSTIFERAPLENIAKSGNLYAYKHFGFWKPMDTLRDNKQLNDLWNHKKAEWKIWKD